MSGRLTCVRPAVAALLKSGLFVGLGLMAAAVRAETPPETLLSADSVFYVRWDGFDVHREAFNNTELGQIFNEELQPLAKYGVQQILEALGPGLQSEKLLEGASPEELVEMQKTVKELPNLLVYLRQHGLVIGLEMISAAPPRWQLTIVLPEAGKAKTADALFGALRLLAKQMGAKTNIETIQGRKVIGVADKGASIAAWQEGDHMVVTIGSEKPERTLKRLDDKTQPTLASSDVYKVTSGFKRYTTYARGYIDTEKVFALLAKELPVAPVFEQLGATGLKRFAFYLGFEGPYQRSTLEAIMPRDQRKGALAIFGTLQPVSVDGLPPIAPDASYVSVTGVLPKESFEYALDVGSVLQGLFSGEKPGALRIRVEAVEKELGVKFREELLASLDAPIVVAVSPSEGLLTLGGTLAIKVKDAKKLNETIDKLHKSLGAIAGKDIHVTKKKYHDVEISMVQYGAGREGIPFRPTYTIHEGWLVIALYPQPVQGYIHRTRQGMARWQPSPLIAQAIDAEKKFRGGGDVKIVGIGESDPRPTIKSVLSLTPLMVAMVGSIGMPGGGKSSFDPSLIPNTQAIIERVRPSVTLIVDDGDSIRVETYATLPLGMHLNGIEMYSFAIIPYVLFRGF